MSRATMCRAWWWVRSGILGVICEVSLKVLPVARAVATLCFDCDERQALEQLNAWASQPLPLSASAWCEGRLRVRLAGARRRRERGLRPAGRRAARCRGGAGVVAGPARSERSEFFALRRRRSGARRMSLAAVGARTSPPARVAGAAVHRMARRRSDGGAPLLRRARCGPPPQRREAMPRWFAAPTSRPAYSLRSNAVLMRIHHGLKQAFDPAGIFNPGRLYAEL